METLYVDYDLDVPRYVYSGCYSCSSLMGTSLCEVKNRGCCSYFPEFNLLEIQRMSKTLEGLHILDTIRNMPSTVIHPFHMHVKGFFDKDGFQQYMDAGDIIGNGEVNDQTVFFRACPFVKSGIGCTLPPRYRAYVCNFFVCKEILDDPELQADLEPYKQERSNYVRWIDWEVSALNHLLSENRINLISDFKASIELLQDTPLNAYEFPQLKPVEFTDKWYRGA